MALLDHWRRAGAQVINGPDVLAIDSSKARQLSLIASLGLAVPATRSVHRIADIEAAAATLSFPLVVKANIGGSGGVMRYDSMERIEEYEGAGLDLLLLQMSPQVEEMVRFAAQVMRTA